MALTTAERAELDALRADTSINTQGVARLENWRRRQNRHQYQQQLATDARMDATDTILGDIITWGDGVNVWGAEAQEAIELASLRAAQARDMAALGITDANRAHARIDDATDPSHTWVIGAWVAAGWTVLALLLTWGASRLSNGEQQLGEHPQFGTLMIGAWLAGLAMIAGITMLLARNRAGRQPAPQPAPVAQHPAPHPAPPTPALGTPAVPAPPAPPAPQPVPVHAGP